MAHYLLRNWLTHGLFAPHGRNTAIPPRSKETELPCGVFVKEDLAKFVNVWNCLPWHAMRGNQKNYAVFMTGLKAKEMQPTNIFFEDSIAKAILFRSAENLYGRKPNAIGDLCYVSVPYARQAINEWGKTTGQLTYHQRDTTLTIADKVKKGKHGFTDLERQVGQFILDLITEQAPELLAGIDEEIAEETPVTVAITATAEPLTIDLIQRAVAWDKKRRVLSLKYHVLLKEIAEGRKHLTIYMHPLVNDKINILKNRGFDPTE